MHLHVLATLLACFVPCLLFFMVYALAFRSFKDREKLSPFECGFEPATSARLPFSLKFFLLAVLFLIFDLEIILLLSSPTLMLSNTPYQTMTLAFFLLILLLGLIYEWYDGSLDWA